VFATFHGYEQYPIPDEAIRRRRFVRRRVINALCMGDFICRWYETSCFAVSYGGVDPVAAPPSLPEQPSAVFIGRLAEDTSLMLYLDALAILRHEYGKSLKLAVVGEGPLGSVAEKFVEAQGLRVRFLGAVADPGPLLDAASFAFVSGYLGIWQALARRRLVFCVYENELKRDYVTCFPEAEKVLVISDSAADLAALLNRHLGAPAAGETMRQRGAQLAAENTWEKVAQLYLAMYRAHGFA
jgi:glycosyltransferase involved in cell wall biosynthesis